MASATIRVTTLYEVAQSNIVLTTQKINVTHQYTYSPYGIQSDIYRPQPDCIQKNQAHYSYQQLINQTKKTFNITQNDLGYTGQASDPSTHLMMLGGFRNYAPGIGKFIQPDSYNSFSKTQINNSKGYVLGNPLFFTDPSGHSFWGAISKFFNPFDQGKTLLSTADQALKGDTLAIENIAFGALTTVADPCLGFGDQELQEIKNVISGVPVLHESGLFIDAPKLIAMSEDQRVNELMSIAEKKMNLMQMSEVEKAQFREHLPEIYRVNPILFKAERDQGVLWTGRSKMDNSSLEIASNAFREYQYQELGKTQGVLQINELLDKLFGLSTEKLLGTEYRMLDSLIMGPASAFYSAQLEGDVYVFMPPGSSVADRLRVGSTFNMDELPNVPQTGVRLIDYFERAILPAGMHILNPNKLIEEADPLIMQDNLLD